jgi:hypothetical protein
MKTKLQNKWRLPTVEEFKKVLYPNMDKIPNLEKDSYYWSSSEYYDSYAWAFSFSIGFASNYFKYSTLQVRPVRDFSSDSTNSPNTTIIGNLEVYNEDLGSMSWSEEAISQRAEEIKAQIDKAQSFFEKEKLQERLGKLIGGDDAIAAIDKLNDNIKISK